MVTKAEIEKGKALFWPDYRKMEQGLEKQLADPNLSVQQRMTISHKLTGLKYRWQESGITDISNVVAIANSIKDKLATAGTMRLSDAEFETIFGEERRHLMQLEQIIVEAKTKGLL